MSVIYFNFTLICYKPKEDFRIFKNTFGEDLRKQNQKSPECKIMLSRFLNNQVNKLFTSKRLFIQHFYIIYTKYKVKIIQE